ncbi:MAG: hypothetical protein QME69_02205 [Candidatus Saccharicenans sp.]|nr:hypothetical protein [Candidatus Saccharicenans sp.]
MQVETKIIPPPSKSSILPVCTILINFARKSQQDLSFRHRHGIQGKGSIRERRSGEPAVGKDLEEARGLIKMALEKAGLPPVKVLLKLLDERRKPKPK